MSVPARRACRWSRLRDLFSEFRPVRDRSLALMLTLTRLAIELFLSGLPVPLGAHRLYGDQPDQFRVLLQQRGEGVAGKALEETEIGRASCRERVCQYV